MENLYLPMLGKEASGLSFGIFIIMPFTIEAESDVQIPTYLPRQSQLGARVERCD